MGKNSVSFHRVIKASPKKLFRAFSDPVALSWWISPYGFLCEVHQMEFKTGGAYRMSFLNFSTGNRHFFGGNYQEIKPHKFIKQTDTFEDPNLPGEMITSVWIKEVSCGSEIKILQEGIPSAIPSEMCYLGWQDSLDKLKKLVEPEIPDA